MESLKRVVLPPCQVNLLLFYEYNFSILSIMTKQGSLSRQATVRLQASDWIERGFDNEEIVEILEVCLSFVRRWRQKVAQGGLAALARKHGSGRSEPPSIQHILIAPTRRNTLSL